jgi:hypothetical protein
MNKKPHGHYCRICGQYRANEKFSGREHTTHICKDCAKRENKLPKIEIELPAFVNVSDIGFDDAEIDSLIFAATDEPPKPKPKPKRKPSKEKLFRADEKRKAKAFLQRILADSEMASAVVHKEAVTAGISIEALHKAKSSLGIKAAVTATGSVWRLTQVLGGRKKAEGTTE